MAAATLQSPEQQNFDFGDTGWHPDDTYIDLGDTGYRGGSEAWVSALGSGDVLAGTPPLAPHRSFQTFGADRPTFAEARKNVDWTKPDTAATNAKAGEDIGSVAVPGFLDAVLSSPAEPSRRPAPRHRYSDYRPRHKR